MCFVVMKTYKQAALLLVLAMAVGVAHCSKVYDDHQHIDSRSDNNVVEYTDEAEADRVPRLPGWGAVNGFNLFAGYITVDKITQRTLFYALAESRRDPATAPVVLWLNGGPGCSSIGGGFMSELGPFLPLPGGSTLQANPHAWNKVANVLFLDSPAYVGFSYSNSTADRIVGDKRTATDSYQFLLHFFDRFPHLRANTFYISGESYAGHYVPNLAWEIVQGNVAAQAESKRINLVGFLVGNPWTDTATDNIGAVDYWWHHALISDETANGIRSNCNFSHIGPLAEDTPATEDVASHRDRLCDRFCDLAFEELGPINIYEIYADVCLPARMRSTGAQLARLLAEHPAGLAARAAVKGFEKLQQQRLQARLSAAAASGVSTSATITSDSAPTDPPYDPCVDNEVEIYLNRPDVQKALHANQTVKLPGPWSDCNHDIAYSHRDLLSSVMPVYHKLLQAGGLRMLIYSGDVDGIVPVVGTRRWVAGLRLEESAPWRPWFTHTGQVGGYVVEYGNVIFSTVRNAGHMVPYVQPERGYHMFCHFIAGRPL